MNRRVLDLPERYDFAGTVGALSMSRHDPTTRVADGGFWWATRTPDGPASLSLRRSGAELDATAYGPGAGWVLDRTDAIAGLRDDITGFASLASAHPVVAQLAKVHSGHRLTATGRVFPRLLRAILEQKVTGKEAYRAYAGIVRHFGEPAPGPVPRLLLPPDPAEIAATPYWRFHRFGLEQRRADTLCRAAVEAERLERCADVAELARRLRAIPGVGAWTVAEVLRTTHAAADEVSVGDYHIPNTVAWALAGEVRGDDARMLELLEPFRGHRGRICTLLELSGIGAPRFGPRMPIRSFAAY